VDELHSHGPDASFSQSLSTWMAIEATNKRVLCEALGRISNAQPRLLTVHVGPGVSAALWLEECRRILDIYNKITEIPAVAVLVVGTYAALPAGTIRADIAWPVGGGGLSIIERWSAYVHERVAWHAGGSLDVVADLAAVLHSVACGDDDALEDALDGHARQAVEELDSVLLQRLRSDLAPALNNPALCVPLGLEGPNLGGARPNPWLARGLLLVEPKHPRRRSLRSLQTCRPLANRLLGRCMDLEQDVRDQLLAVTPSLPPSDRALAQIRSLRDDPRHPDNQLTPRGRAPLQEPWDVVDFNAIVKLELEPRRRDQLHRLRRTRNALAHGVEVGWNALAMVNNIASELTRSDVGRYD
jgi:hypothetical protein